MSALPRSVYLQTYLLPFARMLEREDVTDIYVNRPGEIWVETMRGDLERHAAPELDDTMLWRLARQIASVSHQGISREHPLLSATLPGGERIQIIAPPATRGPLALAVRKHVVNDLSLADYEKGGAFACTRTTGASEAEEINLSLSRLLKAGNLTEFFRLAVAKRKNIVVAGGTSTGKTTFLNALIKEIPSHERLILIEDTEEIRPHNDNTVGLLSVRNELGEAQVTSDQLVQAALRLRPDRIMLGELRGGEAASFLRAINSGHPGSITTVHADNADSAIKQIALLVLHSGLQLKYAEITDYVRSTIDIFVQLSRGKGRRVISEVEFRDG